MVKDREAWHRKDSDMIETEQQEWPNSSHHNRALPKASLKHSSPDDLFRKLVWAGDWPQIDLCPEPEIKSKEGCGGGWVVQWGVQCGGAVGGAVWGW